MIFQSLETIAYLKPTGIEDDSQVTLLTQINPEGGINQNVPVLELKIGDHTFYLEEDYFHQLCRNLDFHASEFENAGE